MPSVLVIAEDWVFRAGLCAELQERGVEARGAETAAQAAELCAAGPLPNAIVYQTPAAAKAGEAELLEQLTRSAPCIVLASRLQAPPDVPGAAAVLYRPLRVEDVVGSVLRMLEGQAA